MKLGLLVSLLIVMLCVRQSQSQCCCSTTGSLSILKYDNYQDAKNYVLNLLGKQYTPKEFMKMLGKLPKNMLLVLLNQLKNLLKYSNGIPAYDPISHSSDFTIYCESHSSSSSLTSQNPETPFSYKTYDRSYFFFPLYRDVANGEQVYLYQSASDTTFANDFTNIVLGLPMNGIFNTDPNATNNMDSLFVNYNDSWYGPLNKKVIQETADTYLCLRGYEYWWRLKINYLIQNTGNIFQLTNYLKQIVIPRLSPIDQQMFARWCAMWIKANYDDGSVALDAMICDADTAATCSNSC